ncbi:hypothetical protein SNEBB_010179 [Seison nebaliae]|nr:hypothetical protein SNEBB_010179 [Seison nebaliae]
MTNWKNFFILLFIITHNVSSDLVPCGGSQPTPAGTTPLTDGPKFPERFRVSFDIISVTDDSVVEGLEHIDLYYDNVTMKASYKYRSGFDNINFIYDFRTQQVLVVEGVYDNNCRAFALSSKIADRELFIRLKNATDGSIVLDDPGNFFFFDPKIFTSYMIGQPYMVPTYQFSACLTNLDILGDRNDKLTVDWYWSNENLLNTSAEIDIQKWFPFQMNIMSSDKKKQKTFKFYDFVPGKIEDMPVERYPGEIDQLIFEVPPGTYCYDRAALIEQQLPVLPISFKFIRETVNYYTGEAEVGSLWYDHQIKLVRYDTTASLASYPYFVTDPLTIIADYNAGVQYAINQNRNNCTVRPMDVSAPALNIQKARAEDNSGSAYIMFTPAELLMLYNDEQQYQFVTKRKERGLTVNTFMGNLSLFVEQYNKEVPTFVEWSFTSNSVAISDEVGDEFNVPIKMRMNILDGDSIFDINFMDFTRQQFSLKTFDLSQCTKEENKLRFILIAELSSYALNFANFDNVAEITLASLASTCEILPTRFEYPKVMTEDNKLYIASAIMEPPAIENRFNFDFEGQIDLNTISANAKVVRATLASSCFSVCLADNSLACKAVYFCNGVCVLKVDRNFDAYFSQGNLNNNARATNITNCFHFSKNSDNDDKIDIVDAYMAMIRLKNSIYNGPLPSIQIGETDTMKVVDIVESNLFTASFAAAGNSLKNFIKRPNYEMRNGTELREVPLDECASACEYEETYDCRSFSYCKDTRICKLSGQSAFDIISPNDGNINLIVVKQNPQADLYLRDYITYFEQLPFSEGFPKSDYKYTMMKSEKLCAKDCLESEEISCKSFIYCPILKECFKLERHYDYNISHHIYAPGDCVQYSKRTLEDFARIPQKALAVKEKEQIYGTTVITCANLCSNDDGIVCTYFEFDRTNKSCRLFNTKDENINSLIVNNANRDIYRRTYYAQAYRRRTRITVTKTVKDHKAMAGIGIGMLILGIAIPCIAYLVLQKFAPSFLQGNQPAGIINPARQL